MPAPIAATLEAFTAAFNQRDLDAAIAAFAEDGEYHPGDGKEHRGRAAIRAALAPQFTGAFGAMRFDLIDQFVDEPARKATQRWICRHDLAGAHGARMALALRWLIRARHGAQVGWHGVDVFHFNAAGEITGKYTYAGYTRPRLERALGVPL
jgi:uncharacterized protein (TIGR02246 family)